MAGSPSNSRFDRIAFVSTWTTLCSVEICVAHFWNFLPDGAYGRQLHKGKRMQKARPGGASQPEEVNELKLSLHNRLRWGEPPFAEQSGGEGALQSGAGQLPPPTAPADSCRPAKGGWRAERPEAHQAADHAAHLEPHWPARRACLRRRQVVPESDLSAKMVSQMAHEAHHSKQT